MEEKDKVVMRRMHVTLVKELDTAGLLLDYLYQEKILTKEDFEKIQAEKTSKKKNQKLLMILEKRRHGLKMLIKALIVTKIQDFLGYEILEKVTWNEEEKKTFEQQLHGNLDELQKLKGDLAAAKRKIQALEMKCEEYERRIERRKEKQQRKLSSRDASRPNVFRRVIRRLKFWNRQDNVTNTEDFHPSLQNNVPRKPPTEALYDHMSLVPDDIPRKPPTLKAVYSYSSASGSFGSNDYDKPLTYRSRGSFSSEPAKREMENRRRADSRTGSVVSSLV